MKSKFFALRPFFAFMLSFVWMLFTPIHAQTIPSNRVIDFRFAPTLAYTNTGFPDDFHKTLVNGDGSLLYDFGPGPYTTKAGTTFSVRMANGELKTVRQTHDDPRVPIVKTLLEGEGVKATVQTFSLIPDFTQKGAVVNVPYTRLLGYTGSLGWAEPAIAADPAFNNVAWGTVRPIHYRLNVPRGSRKQVVLGICESYRIRSGMRIMDFHVEGAEVQHVDPLVTGRTDEPQAFIFQAQDTDRDGDIEVEVLAPEGDPNTTLSVIWMFPQGKTLDKSAIIRGEMTRQAEIYVDAGNEAQVQARPMRMDAISATFEGAAAANTIPQISIKSKRFLSYDPLSKQLMFNGKPFVLTQPTATVEQVSNTEWMLNFPKGTKTATAYVLSGSAPTTVTKPNLNAELAKSKAWWLNSSPLKSGIVQNKVQVPDSTLQAILEVQNRMLFQGRERVDGKLQFQPSFTVYRGLWVHDAAYMMDTALMLGDFAKVRETIQGVMNQRNKEGYVQVMKPNTINRETPLLVWDFLQYGKRSGDWAFVRQNWATIRQTLSLIKKLRDQTLTDPNSLNYGLLPDGFTDGGYSTVKAEYSGVVWALIALHDAVDVAKSLGYTQDATAWGNLYQEMLGFFHKSIKRDARKDEFGNWSIPVIVGQKIGEDVPMRAQWVFLEGMIHGGNRQILPDSLGKGTINMLSAHLVQGLPVSVGFMTGGIWSVFGDLYADALIYDHQPEKALDAIYATANHATPVGTWVEEQMPKDKPARTIGDMPHIWGSAVYIRALIHSLMYEDGKDLRLLAAVAPEWIKPKATLALNDVYSMFGKINLQIKVSQDGKDCVIQLKPLGSPNQQGKIEMSLATFKQLGFKYANGVELPATLSIKWAEPLELLLKKF